MKPSERLQKLLESFLSEKGITVQFNLNIKIHGTTRIKNITDLCKVIVYSRIGWNRAIFWAFCWTHTDENKIKPHYWFYISKEWGLYITSQQKREKIAIKKQKKMIQGVVRGHFKTVQ